MHSDHLKFVKDLALPTDDDLAEFLHSVKGLHKEGDMKLSLKDNTESAQVNAGSLTSFTQSLSGQNKSDVKNSTLLARAGIGQTVQSFRQADGLVQILFEHTGKYRVGISRLSLSIPTPRSPRPFSSMRPSSAFSPPSRPEAELAIVSATMKGLEKLGDDTKQMRVWNANSNSGNNGNFQNFPVDALPNGDVVMALDAMQFNASTSSGRFLWMTWSSTSIKIQRAASKFVLNEDVYAKVRQSIVDKLGDRAIQFVADIEI